MQWPRRRQNRTDKKRFLCTTITCVCSMLFSSSVNFALTTNEKNIWLFTKKKLHKKVFIYLRSNLEVHNNRKSSQQFKNLIQNLKVVYYHKVVPNFSA